MNNIVVKQCLPTADAFNRLRAVVGWRTIALPALTISFKNTLYGVTAEVDGETVACGRIIGDGALYFYIQDVIVLPQYQGQGFGKIIMNNIMNFLKENCPQNSFVGLMAAKGKHAFYEKYGFITRPNEIYGPGMVMIWVGN